MKYILIIVGTVILVAAWLYHFFGKGSIMPEIDSESEEIMKHHFDHL